LAGSHSLVTAAQVRPAAPKHSLKHSPTQTVKRVSLELGGNAPFLVMEDADLGLAAKGVVASALRNSGQTCICANRVFVHDKVGGGGAA
jgi:acyl-CoA reductase-like NAD-dependent aldehyde dehydrogenase